MEVCEVWLARDFLARHSRPVDVPPCTCPQCPPVTQGADMSTTTCGAVFQAIMRAVPTTEDLVCDKPAHHAELHHDQVRDPDGAEQWPEPLPPIPTHREQCEQVDCHNFGGWQDVCGTGPLFEQDDPKAELERARLQIEKLSQTIAAFPDANNAANIAHARAQRDGAREELAKTRAELDEAVKRRNEIQDEWARRMTLLVRLCSGNRGALTDSTLIPVAEVKRAILDAFGTEGQRALNAPAPAEAIRAETLRWAADRIDPGPTATWPTPRSEMWDITLSSRRGVAANLRQWAEANPATTAEPADEPKAIVDLADPNACRHCGVVEPDHANHWTEGVGWHTWVDPGDEVRKTRLLLRRQAAAPTAGPAAS